MKKLLLPIFLMLLLISAATSTGIEPNVVHPSIEGTWELVSRYNYDGENVTDTLTPSKGYSQIKMFYNGKVMWTRYVPNESVEWFGYGTYEVNDEMLTEKLEYMSASMRKVANENMEWNMELQLKQNRFTQIIIDEEGNRITSENYKRLE